MLAAAFSMANLGQIVELEIGHNSRRSFGTAPKSPKAV